MVREHEPPPVQMDDSESGDTTVPAGARMQLEPDAIHEKSEGLALDCPQCGATNRIMSIIANKRCSGYLEEGEAEVESDDVPLQKEGCGAELSLELVWEE